MKKILLISGLALAGVSGCTNSEKKVDGSTAVTTDTGMRTSSDTSNANTANTAMPDSATMMKRWMEYATPGSPHAMMAKWDGTWSGKMIMWMAPGALPDSTTATAVNKMIYGGRYQQSSHSGNMMGAKFEGQSIMGYDNGKKVFQSTWMDNMGTGMMMLEGPWDSTAKTITMTGKMEDPTRGNLLISMRHVIKIIDDNHHLYEMYCTEPDGKEYKTMELAMARK